MPLAPVAVMSASQAKDPSGTALRRELYDDGFDICHCFLPEWYNQSVEQDRLQDELIRLPETGRAILIGNTKRLWPIFQAWYKAQGDSSLLMVNPLDSYCQEHVHATIERHFPSSHSTFWSHTTSRDGLVSMQRVAMVSGFAYFDSSTNLTVHPVYGAWHSYRAVVVLHGTSDSTAAAPAPAVAACLFSTEEHECVERAMETLRSYSGNAIESAPAESHIAFYRALIRLRDCVERGKEGYRFGEDQIMYHYTKDVKYI